MLRKILDKALQISYTTICKEISFTGGAFMNQKDTQIDKLDEIVTQSILYDFYGELLSDHKKQIFEDYVLNDLSLSEIAAEQGISRQGVHDIVKRCTSELKEYEAKLNLVSRFKSIKEKLSAIKEIVTEVASSNDRTQITTIAALADDILKEL
jgi:predicted DNA-binding protein YlxM (UPF0122 family)